MRPGGDPPPWALLTRSWVSPSTKVPPAAPAGQRRSAATSGPATGRPGSCAETPIGILPAYRQPLRLADPRQPRSQPPPTATALPGAEAARQRGAGQGAGPRCPGRHAPLARARCPRPGRKASPRRSPPLCQCGWRGRRPGQGSGCSRSGAGRPAAWCHARAHHLPDRRYRLAAGAPGRHLIGRGRCQRATVAFSLGGDLPRGHHFRPAACS